MIRLRPAEREDEWTAWELRREIQPELTRAEHRSWWKAVTEHRFIACDGATVVGILRVSHHGEIHILVAEKERGKGLGTQMLEKIQFEAAKLGFKRLWAAVDAANAASQQAFMAAGYAPTRFEVTL